jgi:uncharacterized membrane protein (DUF106 family)
MLISKRSRRQSSTFESKFRTGSGIEFPLRQYLRCREEFISLAFQAALLSAFTFTLILFGGTLNDLFNNHGAHLNPLFRWLAFAVLFVFIVSILRRIYYKVAEMKEIRREMARLKEQFRHPET